MVFCSVQTLQTLKHATGLSINSILSFYLTRVDSLKVPVRFGACGVCRPVGTVVALCAELRECRLG